MADVIDRQKAIEALKKGRPAWVWKDGNDYQYGRASQWTSDIMTIECVEAEDLEKNGYVKIIRCKDCVYYEELNNNKYYCDAIYRDLCGDDEGVDFEPPEDHFCAYGVRREADGDDQ